MLLIWSVLYIHWVQQRMRSLGFNYDSRLHEQYLCVSSGIRSFTECAGSCGKSMYELSGNSQTVLSTCLCCKAKEWILEKMTFNCEVKHYQFESGDLVRTVPSSSQEFVVPLNVRQGDDACHCTQCATG